MTQTVAHSNRDWQTVTKRVKAQVKECRCTCLNERNTDEVSSIRRFLLRRRLSWEIDEQDEGEEKNRSAQITLLLMESSPDKYSTRWNFFIVGRRLLEKLIVQQPSVETDKWQTADLKVNVNVCVHCLCEHTAAPAGRKVLPILLYVWSGDWFVRSLDRRWTCSSVRFLVSELDVLFCVDKFFVLSYLLV